MKAAGVQVPKLSARLIVLALVALAILFGLYVLQRRSAFPTTDDATIDADVVHVAAAVGGRVIAIPVAENAQVKAGDLLFQIDPTPFRLAVRQAHAELGLAEATLETQRRVLSTQRSTATVAGDQVRRAEANLQLARRTVERLRPLAAKGYIPQQQFDQAQTAQHDAETSLVQAREQSVAALRAVDTEAGAEATVQARRAALAIAERALDDTTVRAAHPGRIVGLTAATGEMVIPSQTLFTLVKADEWFAVANFREIDLHAIKVGDCATVFSMIDRRRPMRGVVQGIGAGVLDTDRVNLPRALPYVERSLSWVRVAQRFPVRIRIEGPQQDLMRVGASAVVEVKHGAACK
jgi:multidrug efflux system membrane fusion protein